MLPINQVVEVLEHNLPYNLKSKAPELAGVISEIVNNKEVGPIQSNLGIDEALAALAGKTLRVKDSVISFGEGNLFGDIIIRDVVNGNVINISISIVSPEEFDVKGGLIGAGIKHLEHQNFTEAITSFSSAINESPTSLAYLGRAVAQIEELRKKYRDALRWRFFGNSQSIGKSNSQRTYSSTDNIISRTTYILEMASSRLLSSGYISLQWPLFKRTMSAALNDIATSLELSKSVDEMSNIRGFRRNLLCANTDYYSHYEVKGLNYKLSLDSFYYFVFDKFFVPTEVQRYLMDDIAWLQDLEPTQSGMAEILILLPSFWYWERKNNAQVPETVKVILDILNSLNKLTRHNTVYQQQMLKITGDVNVFRMSIIKKYNTENLESQLKDILTGIATILQESTGK